MPRTGDDISNICFDVQGKDLLIVVYQQQLLGGRYNHAAHKLTPNEIEQLKGECEKALGDPKR